MLIAEAVGRALVAAGIDHVFGVVGSGNFHVTNAMVAAGNSLWVAGTITKDARTVAFDWPLKSGVAWSDCGPEMGDKGFAVPSGGTVQVKATIHGDNVRIRCPSCSPTLAS